jgi:hypothetical protein
VGSSGFSLFSVDFWAGPRPPSVPLLYKLLPDSNSWRALGQLVVSIGSWLTLAGVVAWCVRTPALRWVSAGLVLLLSLSVWVTQWDPLILSESLSLSLGALTLAAWLALARAPGGWTVAAVLAASLAWVFARDTNAYLVLMAVPLALGWALLRRPRGLAAVLAAGLVAIFAMDLVSQAGPHASFARWEQPILNVIGERVLTNPEELDYFRDRGMPLPRKVRALTGQPLGHPLSDDPSPKLLPFRDWVRDDGRTTLAGWLASHPHRAVRPVVADRYMLFDPDPWLRFFRPRGNVELLPSPLQRVVFPPWPPALVVWALAALAAAVWLARRGHARATWLVPSAAVLFQIPHAAIVWNGDSVDVARHALLVGVLARLGLLVLTLFLVDAALERRASAK